MGLKKRKSEASKPELVSTSSLPPLGEFSIPNFDKVSIIFGAELRQYPHYESIPQEFRRGHTVFNKAASGLFFRGGRLEDFGVQFRAGINPGIARAAIHAWLCSFAPPHEQKEATVAWALSVWGEPRLKQGEAA